MKKVINYVALAVVMTACVHKEEVGNVEKGKEIVRVKTEEVKSVKGITELRYSGTIEPSQTIPLTFQSSGIVTSVMVQEGDMVRKGQLLASVDKSDNENMYNAAISKYNQAKDAYDRLKSVHENGSLPEIKWVEMETNLKQAESQAQIAKSNLEKCYMRAPETGMIGNRNIEPGQASISAGTPIELVKIDEVLVKIAVPENEISKIRKGQKASFSISALDGKSFEGQVANIGVVADKIARTYEVKIKVRNSDLQIKPGMVCDVKLDIGSQNAAMVVSYNAVSSEDNEEPFVYVVSPDKKSVKKQHVTIGQFLESGIEIRSGLSLNQTIVSEGKEKLSDNSLISL